MKNQTANDLNVLSGAVAASLIDGLFLLCEDMTVLLELYSMLDGLYENGRYAEGCQLLAVFSKIVLWEVPNFSAYLKSETEMNVFLREFLEDFSEILWEYHYA